MIAGIACLLACLCYAELSSTMPTSGSAYTFTYVIFGEVWAWIIGWALILELELAAAVVARAWSLITVRAITEFGVRLPYHERGRGRVRALFILVVLTGVVALGARVGLRALWVMVAAKLLAIGGGHRRRRALRQSGQLRRPLRRAEAPGHRRRRPCST